MSQRSISTPNSRVVARKAWRQILRLVLWVILFLCLIDGLINQLYPYPSVPNVKAGELSRYFNYGRSIEGKLPQIIGPTNESSSKFAVVGWLDPALLPPAQPPGWVDGKGMLVSIYGMSFSAQVGYALQELDRTIGLRLIAAPAAPPSYTYAAYQLDRDRHPSDVVILGVLASSVKALRSISALTWQFEAPVPYTYPRYFLRDGKMTAIEPKVTSLDQFRAARQNPSQWQEVLAQMQAYDEYFDPFLFKQSWFDRSVLVRMVRRAWAQRHQAAMEQKSYTANGFNPDYEIPLLQAIVSDFAKTATQDGKLPIVILFNDRGYHDHLFQALKPTLEQESIPYISTHTIAPASDPANFVKDGHFTKQANLKITEAVVELINQHLKQGSHTS